MRKSVLPYVNNNDAHQPMHPHSLISAFVIRYLGSIMTVFTMAEISRRSNRSAQPQKLGRGLKHTGSF